VLLVCDHASNRVPEAMDNLGLPDEVFAEHVAYDIGAAAVTRRLSAALNAPAVLCNYSRLVVDCNRQPGDPTAIPPTSDGISIPGNQDLSEVEEEARTEGIFWPYHKAISDALAHLWRRIPHSPPALLAIHSFTPCMRNGTPRPWHIGFLWNHDPRLALPLMRAFRHMEGTCVGDNEPYDGRLVNYTADTHAKSAGLPHVSVEIRQDLIADEAGQAEWADRLAAALDPLLGREDIHAVQHY